MSKKFQNFPVLIATFLTGCVTSPDPAASDREKTDALQVYVACLHREATQIDDSKSDALTVALALKSLCTGEFEQSIRISGQGMNPTGRRMFETQIREHQTGFGVTLFWTSEKCEVVEISPLPTTEPIFRLKRESFMIRSFYD